MEMILDSAFVIVLFDLCLQPSDDFSILNA